LGESKLYKGRGGSLPRPLRLDYTVGPEEGTRERSLGPRAGSRLVREEDAWIVALRTVTEYILGLQMPFEIIAGGLVAKGFGALGGGALLKKVYDDKKNEKDNFSLDDEFGDCEVSWRRVRVSGAIKDKYSPSFFSAC
jgi:hypothetical protein